MFLRIFQPRFGGGSNAAMSCGLADLSTRWYQLISEDKLQRKLNDSGTGTEAQNFAEIGSADVADGVVPIRMVQYVEEVGVELQGPRCKNFSCSPALSTSARLVSVVLLNQVPTWEWCCARCPAVRHSKPHKNAQHDFRR